MLKPPIERLGRHNPRDRFPNTVKNGSDIHSGLVIIVVGTRVCLLSIGLTKKKARNIITKDAQP